jgi:hypothetical protein
MFLHSLNLLKCSYVIQNMQRQANTNKINDMEWHPVFFSKIISFSPYTTTLFIFLVFILETNLDLLASKKIVLFIYRVSFWSSFTFDSWVSMSTLKKKTILSWILLVAYT